MKKKITAIALAVCILVIGVVGATMSYFTDKKTATNTFTFGNGVKIDLTETSTADLTNNIRAGIAYDSEGKKSNEDGYDATKFAGFSFDKVLPGLKYSKEPVITVKANSAECWLVATLTVDHLDVLDKLGTPAAPFDILTTLGGGDVFNTNPTSDTSWNGLSGYMFKDGSGTNQVFVTYTDDNTNHKATYTCYFVNKQASSTNDVSYTLFKTVQIPTGLTQEMLDTDGNGTIDVTSLDMTVKAYAIQAEGFDNAKVAYETAFPSGN